ncbi:type IV secretion system protein [Patescibacteria group bacterium]|nr:type IV secretion system protein [Patescibacteria group bacterium]
MKNKEYKKFLKVAAVAFLIAAPLLVLPQTTHAVSLFGVDLSPAGLVTAGFRAIAYVFNFLFGLLYILGSYLVQVALNLNGQILNHQNQIVTIGWTILRDIANLGFVLVMIIIAVATIVRYKEYNAKSLLPKLIAAAIIVNFSLTIAGAFIVFSDSLTNVFLAGKLGGSPSEFATAITVAFEPQALYLPPQNPPPPNPSDQGSAASGFGEAILTGIAGLVFSMVFTLIAALVMFALAFMLIVRYVMLSILLLTAPITWLFWVFPPLNKIFHDWWSRFLDWVFFLPAVAFFIYLALTSVQFFDSLPIDTSSSLGGTLSNVFNQGIKMIILCGLMIGGLFVAKNMGITGAAGAIKLAKGVGDSTKKWAKNTSTRLAQRAATYPLRTERGRNVVGGLQRFGQDLPRGLRWLGAPVRNTGNVLSNQRAKYEKLVSDANKKIPKDLREGGRQYYSMDNPSRVAYAMKVMKEKRKRDDAAETALEKRRMAATQVEDAEAALAAAEKEGDLKKSGPAREALAKAIANREKVTEDTKGAVDAVRDMAEIMAQLPKKAREEFVKAEATMKATRGKKFKGSPIAETRLGQVYGVTNRSFGETEGKTDKIEKLMKEVYEEGGEGGEKKPESGAKPAGGGEGGGKK